jgi:hypothetical protein
MQIYEQIFAQGKHLLIQPSEKPFNWQHLLPPTNIGRVGFSDKEALLPVGSRSFQGYRLLHEYFAFPQRFLFFRIKGLQKSIHRCDDNRLDLIILFNNENSELEGRVDAGNLLLFRAGLVPKIDIGMIGRMAAGWGRGRFRYGHPGEMRRAENEKFYGYVTHYAIGVGFAVPYAVGWRTFLGGEVSPGWAIAYGLLTTLASWFFVYPSMGLGALGRRSPDGMRATLSPLANHLFFGLGMALGFAMF